MDVMMLSITGGALVLAIVMAVVAVRLLRAERARSTARIDELQRAALEQDFGDAIGNDPIENDPIVNGPIVNSPIVNNPINDLMFRSPAVLADSQVVRLSDNQMTRRFLALAAVAIVMASGIGAGYFFLKPTALNASSAPETRSSTVATGAPAPAATAPPTTTSVPANQTPIELLSLKHSTDGSTFAVTGLVQNPLAGTALPHVVAVVYVFDKDGTYVTSGKASLEFTGLRPGEESPFVVRIANPGVVAKYRVGFRREDGSVIAHVDKRNQTAASLMTEAK